MLQTPGMLRLGFCGGVLGIDTGYKNHEITQDLHESFGKQNLVKICENLVVEKESNAKFFKTSVSSVNSVVKSHTGSHKNQHQIHNTPNTTPSL